MRLDTGTLLSTLWIVVLINMLKSDVLSLNIPGAAEEVARTAASTGASTPQLMLAGAIIGNLGVAMIVLSRILPQGMNRLANMVLGAVMIAYIWVGAASYPHYLFIAVIETLCLVLIIWLAWKWRKTEA